ncbi:hypothetical protein BC941DRAFT_497345, partial [Chlamydoabsidia padenii]
MFSSSFFLTMIHPIPLLLCLLSTILFVYANDTLSVYHKRGGDYLKRGDIIDIPHAPKYVSVEHGHGDLGPGLYQVKIKNDKTGVITLSSIPSCQLKASGFADQFRIHLDDQQQIYHVDYYADTFECDPLTATQPTEEFKSKVDIIHATNGVKPVLGQFNGKAQKPKPTAKQQRPDDERTEEEEEEEKTFFQKYWYLILAGGFMLMSNMAAPPEPAAGNGASRR